MINKHTQRERTPGPFARFMHGALAVLLAACFGLGAGALGTHGLLTAVIGPIKQDGWGAAPAWLLMMAIGGVVGLVVGTVAAFGHLRRYEMHALGPCGWLGLLAGVALSAGLFQLVSDRYGGFMNALWLTVIVPPCLVVGRALIGQVLRDRIERRR